MNLNRSFAIVLRHYYLTLHQMERFFDVIISPVLVLILWGFLAKYVQDIQSQTLAAFLLGGMILWVIFEKVSTDFFALLAMLTWGAYFAFIKIPVAKIG